MSDNINYLKLLFESGENSEAFNQKINDFFPALIYVYDPAKRKLRYVNRQLTDILGFSYEELSTTDDGLMNLIFSEDLEAVKGELEKFHSIKDDEALTYGCRLNHKQGSWRYFRTVGTVLRRDVDGKAASLLFIAQDITDQLKSAEESTAIRELFNETEDLLHFGSWSWDAKTNKSEWTRGLYKIFEYEPGEVEELDREFYFKHMNPEDVEQFTLLADRARAEKSSYEFEYVITTRTGKKKIVSTTARTITDKDGHLFRVAGITRDLTAVRNFEKERERSIRELNRSNKELEEFAYVASHDLQEPVRKIATFGERLKSKYEDVLGTDGNLYLDRIMASTEYMRVLIDNLLEFSRTTRSSRAYQTCPLDQVVRDVVAELDLKVEETRAEVEVNALPVIEAVPSEMNQLFNNLISNAIKFRKPETHPLITITADTVSKSDKDRFHLPIAVNFHKITVQDNGIGFEPEYEEKIFQIFQRLHGKTEYAGSGIGLAICKKIVDNHEGVIYAEGKLGQGAKFVMFLPEKQYI
jgi:PAS domain S-box-containing protein